MKTLLRIAETVDATAVARAREGWHVAYRGLLADGYLDALRPEQQIIVEVGVTGATFPNQAANAAVNAKGSIFASSVAASSRASGTRRRSVRSHHRRCRLIWKILHQGVRYEERGPR